MFGLQELFDQQIEHEFTPNKLGVRILERDLEKIGIFISDEQREDLEEQFKCLENGYLTFNFTDQQLKNAGVTSEEELLPKIKGVLSNLESSIHKFSAKIDDTMEDLVQEIVNKLGTSVKLNLEKRMNDMLEDQELIRNDFNDEIQDVWGGALDLLQGLIVIADEAAQGYLVRSDEYSQNDIVQDILLRIHAKANQVSKEILTLLRHGFADGAQARWRSLHELAVVSSFIAEHGDEVALRYIQHEAIETYNAAKQYNEYCDRLGTEKISQEEISTIESEYKQLINKYGKSYRSDYGWAASALNLERPTFRDIEKSIELDHLRPYYKAASSNIHANPKGVFSRLGLLPDEEVLLAGPSSIGLSDPAQSTIISLTQITSSVLTYNSTIDFLVVCKAMSEYSKDVEMEFVRIESELNVSDITQNNHK